MLLGWSLTLGLIQSVRSEQIKKSRVVYVKNTRVCEDRCMDKRSSLISTISVSCVYPPISMFRFKIAAYADSLHL